MISRNSVGCRCRDSRGRLSRRKSVSGRFLVSRDNPGDCRVAGRCCRLVGPEVVGGDSAGGSRVDVGFR